VDVHAEECISQRPEFLHTISKSAPPVGGDIPFLHRFLEGCFVAFIAEIFGSKGACLAQGCGPHAKRFHWVTVSYNLTCAFFRSADETGELLT
jgi:hypothetical protein